MEGGALQPPSLWPHPSTTPGLLRPPDRLHSTRTQLISVVANRCALVDNTLLSWTLNTQWLGAQRQRQSSTDGATDARVRSPSSPRTRHFLNDRSNLARLSPGGARLVVKASSTE